MTQPPAKLAYLGVPEGVRRVLRRAFSRVWSGPQEALERGHAVASAPRLFVVSHPDPDEAWHAVAALEPQHPFVPVLAVLRGARNHRRDRSYPSRVDWVADFEELDVPTLRLAIRFARERAHRRELQHRLDEQQLEDLGWIVGEVSHEISNPLLSLLSSLEWLQARVGQAASGSAPLDYDEVVEALRDSWSSACHVSRVAEDLTRSSRLRRVGRVELRDVLDTVRRLASKPLASVQLRIRNAHGPTVRADETRLCQVFLNLLRNAAQALEHCEEPRIDVTVQPPSRGRVTIVVRDNGPGVPDTVVDQLFEPWVSSKESGTGLGLAVSVRHIAQMGGELRLVETGPEGTTFAIELEALAGRAARPTLVPDPEVSHGRVLVVDDTLLVRRSIARALVGNRHEVEAVSTVDEALARVRSDAFDVAIIDLQLPDGSGIELYEALERSPPSTMPEFLFLSGEFDSDALTWLESRSLRWLRKPVGARRLHELVVEILQQRPSRDVTPDRPDASGAPTEGDSERPGTLA